LGRHNRRQHVRACARHESDRIRRNTAHEGASRMPKAGMHLVYHLYPLKLFVHLCFSATLCLMVLEFAGGMDGCNEAGTGQASRAQ